MSKKTEVAYIEENILNIKKCFKGILETTDGRYLTAIEVLPINFKFKTGHEKEMVIDSFEKYLKIAPIKFQIKSVSKKTNVNKLIQTLDEEFYSLDNLTSKLIDIHKDEIKFIRRLGSREGIERHFYLIFEYCPNDTFVAKDEDDIVYYLNSAKESARQYLYACGNPVITHENDDYWMLELCYSILNKKKTIKDMYRAWNKIVDDANEYYDYDEEALENMKIPFDNIASPNEIKIFSSYCIIDGIYYTFLFIPSQEYPPCIAPAWLSGLINSGEGIDVDIFVKREETNKVRSQLRRKKRINGVRINHMDVSGANYEEVEKSLNATDYLKDKLSIGDSLYYINTMITISGNDFDEMYIKYSAVKEMMDTTDVQLMECKYNVDKFLVSYLPFNKIEPKIFEKTKRNIPTSDLAAFYPMTSYEVSDDDGIMMGVNKDNNSLCVLDNFNTDKYKNANIAILGTSGAGKTFTLSVMLKRFRMKGINTYLIAPWKGHEYKRLCKALDGQYIRLSAGSKNIINVMEIRPKNNEINKELGIEDEKEEDSVILNDKIDNLLVFFSLIFTDMLPEEKGALDDAIIETYKRKGITSDNDSLIDHYVSVTDKNGTTIQKEVYKEMPILEDLYNVLCEKEETKRLAVILKQFVTGSASSFNGHTNVDLDNPFTVIDISQLSKPLIPIGMFIAVDLLWDKIKEDIIQKKIIAIDELWYLMKSNVLAAEFVLNIFKTIRGYSGGAIAASQDIKDFFAFNGGEYGKAIISNSKTKIILQLEHEEAETVQDAFDLSHSELKDIESFERGQMLITSNTNKFTLRFLATDLEEALVTTDRKRLAEIHKSGILNGWINDNELDYEQAA